MLPDPVFQPLVQKIKSLSGIVLTKDKSYLLESRLNPLLQKHGCATLEQFALKFISQNTGPIVDEVIDAMTTNETLFFRDNKPFDTFKTVCLPHLMKNRPEKKIRIWSAAASTGQEAYSLCMILKEMGAALAGWQFDILGTDLCNKALQKAQEATYTQFEVQRGMPIMLLMKYFTQNGDKWHLKDEIKNMVSFKKFNLLDNSSAFGKFDVVMLRNVLIYFDMPTKKAILDKIAQQLRPDGFLFLGGAETVVGVTNTFNASNEHRGLYLLNTTSSIKATA